MSSQDELHTPPANRSLRPILPMPHPRPTLPAQGEVMVGRARRNAVLPACERCRKHKTKCSGQRPRCAQCESHGSECVYAETKAEATQALRLQVTSAERRLEAFESLFDMLKEGDELAAAAMLTRMRQSTNTDVESLVRHFRAGDLLLQLALRPDTTFRYVFPYIKQMPARLVASSNIPYRTSLLYLETVEEESTPAYSDSGNSGEAGAQDGVAENRRMYLAPYHAAQLVDSRLGSVKASTWTTVTADDVFVQKLLEVYFLSDHSFYPMLHKDIVLEDMVAGRRRYCSSLLVNAILAQGCHGYTPLEGRARFWDPKTWGYKFLSEARRLWELEAGSEPKITTVQAAGIFCMIYSVDGMDRIGNKYLDQGVHLAKQMALFDTLSHISNALRRKVYTITAWNIFCLQSITAFHYWMPPWQSEPPREPLPAYSEAADYFGEMWIRYPDGKVPLPVACGETIRATSELRAIMGNIALRSFSLDAPSGRITWEDAVTYRTMLQTWYHGLPQALGAQHLVLPAQIKLHLHYYFILTSIFESFASEETSRQVPLLPGDITPHTPRTIVTHSQASVEMLLRLFYLRHGFALFDSGIGLWLMMAGNVAVMETKAAAGDDGSSTGKQHQQDVDAALSTIILCARGMLEQGRHSHFHQGILYAFRANVRPSDRELVDRHLQEVATATDVVDDKLLTQIQSILPVNVISIADDVKGKELGKVIEGLVNLSTAPDDGDSSSSLVS